MHTTQNGMHQPLPCQLRDVIQRVDHARVCTPEDDDQAVARFDVKCLVVRNDILPGALFVQEKRSARILKPSQTRNLARGLDSRADRPRPSCEGQIVTAPKKLRRDLLGNANRSAWGLLSPYVLGFESERMDIYDHPSGSRKNSRQPAGVVAVAVADHDCIRLTQVDSKLPGIWPQRLTLSRV